MTETLTFLETHKDSIRNILNALKNPRRRALLEILVKDGPCDVATLQKKLKDYGYYHSQSTIENSYVLPLIKAELVRREDNKFAVTDLGVRIYEIIKDREWPSVLAKPNQCYEELVLLFLHDSPKPLREVLLLVPGHEISRVLKRIADLIEKQRTHVYCTPLLPEPPSDASPAEREIFNIIKEEGEITVSEVIRRASVIPRTVFKCLRRLKEKKAIKSYRRPSMIALNEKGKEVAAFLWSIASQILRKTEEYDDLVRTVVEYLSAKVEPVTEMEMIEECLDPFYRKKYGRSISPEEFQEIKRKLKRMGLLEGDPYSGYRLSERAHELLTAIVPAQVRG